MNTFLASNSQINRKMSWIYKREINRKLGKVLNGETKEDQKLRS